REPDALLEREGDPRLPFVEDRDLRDLSHADTREADVVGLVEGGDGGEGRVELRSSPTTDTGEGRGEETGREDGDHGEHDEFDQGCCRTSHWKLTSVPRIAGAPSRVVQDGTSSGSTPVACP